jgi:hypothetical protein
MWLNDVGEVFQNLGVDPALSREGAVFVMPRMPSQSDRGK